MKSRINVRTVAVAVGLLIALGASACATQPGAAGQRASDVAATQMGNRYVYGGSSPGTGFDCSGLTSWAWRQAGVNLPRTATDQYWATTRISRQQLQPGDLVFYGTGTGNIVHVGLYVGGDYMISASNPGRPVERVNIDQWWVDMRFAFGRVNA